jgi:hypothetical protein
MNASGTLMHEHAVGEAASADQAEDAVAGRPVQHLRAAGLDRSRDLEPGDVLRAPGWCGIRALALGEVGGIEPRIGDAHEQLLAAGHRVGPLLEADDLVAACSGEDHCAHVCSLG